MLIVACALPCSSEAVEITAKPEPEDHQLNSEPNSPASMGSSGAINDIIDVPDRMVGLSMCCV